VPVVGALVVVPFFANHETLRYIGVRGVRYLGRKRNGNKIYKVVQQTDNIEDSVLRYDFLPFLT
jgi:hypothetical protein